MDKHVLLCALLSIFFPLNALSEDNFKAHRLDSNPFNEQWFYSISDPKVGFMKVSLQTYATQADEKLRPHVHFAFSDKYGKLTSYDYFFDNVELTFSDDNQPFLYKISDKVIATKEGVELHTDEVDFSFYFTGPDRLYWSEERPDASPFGALGSLPTVNSRWYLSSTGTPINYELSLHNPTDNEKVANQYSGSGDVVIDKGWYKAANRGAFAYVLGIDPEASLMFTGAQLETLPLELWAGRYVSVDHDLLFRKAIEGFTMKRRIDACAGEMDVEMINLNRRISLSAKAPLESFQVFDYPNKLVFGDDTLLTKSMSATIDVEVSLFDEVKETHQFNKGLLEFSGSLICPDLASKLNGAL